MLDPVSAISSISGLEPLRPLAQAGSVADQPPPTRMSRRTSADVAARRTVPLDGAGAAGGASAPDSHDTLANDHRRYGPDHVGQPRQQQALSTRRARRPVGQECRPPPVAPSSRRRVSSRSFFHGRARPIQSRSRYAVERFVTVGPR